MYQTTKIFSLDTAVAAALGCLAVRIGVLTTSYPRWAGDASGQFVAALNRYLVAAGHQVEVLSAGPAQPTRSPDDEAILSSRPGAVDEVCESGVVVRRVPSALFYAGGAPDALAQGPAMWLEAARFTARLARHFWAVQGRYEALVSHWLVPCGVLAERFAARRPHIAIAHSSDIHLLRRLHGQSLVRWVSRRARLIYTADSLVVPGANGRVVPMGIDCAQLAGSPQQRQAARAQLAVERPTILFLGRLVPVKGVSVLLRSLCALPSAVLWLAGDGPLRAALHDQVRALGLQDRVQFLGSIAGDERRQRLWACDVLAVPSVELADGRSEGAPQVVLEGLAAGAHVVASRVGGIASLLGDAGWCVPPGDVPGWTAALAQALATSVESRRAQAWAQVQRFDWSMVGPQIVGDALDCRPR